MSFPAGARGSGLTLQLDVSMNEADRVHPPQHIGQLSEDSPHQRFRRLVVVVGQEVEQLTTG